MAQTLRERLIGAWKLVSYVEEPVDGSAPFYPMGEEPQGIIMYTPDGYMSAQLMHPVVPSSRPATGFVAAPTRSRKRRLATSPIAVLSTQTRKSRP
jgi:hypothetical protein